MIFILVQQIWYTKKEPQIPFAIVATLNKNSKVNTTGVVAKDPQKFSM